ncbi:MAG: hypothetical protein ACC726_05395 [Chloroflexota bacterium]
MNEADASFCTECNSYLEWSGEKVHDGAPTPSERAADDPAASAAEEPPMESTEVPVGSETSSPVPPADAVEPLPRSDTRGADSATPAATDASADQGAEPLPARTPIAATPEQPSSRRPVKATAMPAARPRQAAAVRADVPQPGEVICAACGTGNDPARKYCRRCGQSLAPARAAVAPAGSPWYRRIVRRKTPETYAAGTRPADLGRRRGWRPGCLSLVLGFLLMLGIGGVAAYLSVPSATDLVDDAVAAVTELVGGRTLAYPTAGGRSAAGRPAADAVDGNLATYWLGRQNDAGRWALELRFERAVDLRSINVHSGAEGDEYLQFGRPRQVRIRSGAEDSGVVTLEDIDAIQSIAVDLSGIRELRFIVLDTYRGERGANDVAIRELEFEVVK